MPATAPVNSQPGLNLAPAAGTAAGSHAGHGHGPDEGHAEVERISVTDLKAAMDRGEVVLLDTREDQVYKESHIKGALLLGAPELQGKLNAMKRDQAIVTYCT